MKTKKDPSKEEVRHIKISNKTWNTVMRRKKEQFRKSSGAQVEYDLSCYYEWLKKKIEEK